jgi:hypothetical protein
MERRKIKNIQMIETQIRQSRVGPRQTQSPRVIQEEDSEMNDTSKYVGPLVPKKVEDQGGEAKRSKTH